MLIGILLRPTQETKMDFGRRIKRNKVARWIWRYTKFVHKMKLISDKYFEFVMVIGNTFICTNCCEVFNSEDDAFIHVKNVHSKDVSPLLGQND